MVNIEIDDKSPQAQKVIEMLIKFPFVKIKDKVTSKKEKSYDPKFVKKILYRSDNAKNGKVVEVNNEY
jgi:hypothetical protein